MSTTRAVCNECGAELRPGISICFECGEAQEIQELLSKLPTDKERKKRRYERDKKAKSVQRRITIATTTIAATLVVFVGLLFAVSVAWGAATAMVVGLATLVLAYAWIVWIGFSDSFSQGLLSVVFSPIYAVMEYRECERAIKVACFGILFCAASQFSGWHTDSPLNWKLYLVQDEHSEELLFFESNPRRYGFSGTVTDNVVLELPERVSAARGNQLCLGQDRDNVLRYKLFVDPVECQMQNFKIIGRKYLIYRNWAEYEDDIAVPTLASDSGG